MTRVLITGIAGHIGSKLAEHCLAAGDEVHGIDDLSCGYYESVPAGCTWWKQGCHPLPAESYDVVYHCAAYAAEVMSPHLRAFNYRNNVVETAHVVNHCVRTGARLVYFSSAAVYGERSLKLTGDVGDHGPPFSEDMIPVPHDPYGVAKLACEMDVRIAGEQHGLRWCVLRPHNVYGPGQSIWQRYRNVFGIWFSRLFQGLPIQVFGDGGQRRAFSYVDDVIPCVRRAGAGAADGEVVNLGGREPTVIWRAAEWFAETFGATVENLPARHEVTDVWTTTEKSERLLGYEERVGLMDGLERMHSWALDAWSRYPERRARPELEIELWEGMPQSWAEELR